MGSVSVFLYIVRSLCTMLNEHQNRSSMAICLSGLVAEYFVWFFNNLTAELVERWTIISKTFWLLDGRLNVEQWHYGRWFFMMLSTRVAECPNSAGASVISGAIVGRWRFIITVLYWRSLQGGRKEWNSASVSFRRSNYYIVCWTVVFGSDY